MYSNNKIHLPYSVKLAYFICIEVRKCFTIQIITNVSYINIQFYCLENKHKGSAILMQLTMVV